MRGSRIAHCMLLRCAWARQVRPAGPWAWVTRRVVRAEGAWGLVDWFGHLPSSWDFLLCILLRDYGNTCVCLYACVCMFFVLRMRFSFLNSEVMYSCFGYSITVGDNIDVHLLVNYG